MDEKTREMFREFGRKGYEAKLKKYGKKAVILMNRKAGLAFGVSKKLSTPSK